MVVFTGGVEPGKNLSLFDDPMYRYGNVVRSTGCQHQVEDFAVCAVHARDVAAQQGQGCIAVRQHGEDVACGQSSSLRL